MGRLIDVDELHKMVKEPTIYDINVTDVLSLIDDCPTAYSVEAVVRELEAAREPHKQIADSKGWPNRDRVHAIGIVGAYNHAIAIVKRGGRDD